jgi:hypothetical protein
MRQIGYVQYARSIIVMDRCIVKQYRLLSMDKNYEFILQLGPQVPPVWICSSRIAWPIFGYDSPLRRVQSR